MISLSGNAHAASPAERYEKEILPIMVNYCYDCHGDGSSEGHLELDSWETIEEMTADRGEWRKIRDHIDFRLMPPPDEFAPDEAERAKLVEWIDEAIFPVDAANPDPGHVTLRRLNRNEYENTIRDLLGVKAEVTDILPLDDSGYGFDNIGDVLTLSPLHMERYLEAAEVALDLAVDLSPPRFPEVEIQGQQLKGAGNRSGSALMLASNGEATAYRKPGGGRFKFTVTARADAAGDEAAKMELKVNDSSVRVWEVTDENGSNYNAEVFLEEGKSTKVTVGFLNDYYDETQPEGKRDRNLLVENVAIEGPLDGPPLRRSGSHRGIFTERREAQSDRDYMTTVMRPFMEKAFRRPLETGEAERYLVFLKNAEAQGESVDYAIRQALAAVLVSPSFLFREEPGLEGEGKTKELVDEHALASRLSYFLWSHDARRAAAGAGGQGGAAEEPASGNHTDDRFGQIRRLR